jgi:uncharacterized protein (UPF0218 family)
MKLLFTLFLVAVISILPSCSTAQAKEELWHIGDGVTVFLICETEKDILDIALADSKSKENFKTAIVKKQLKRKCVRLNPPSTFVVHEIITTYKDYDQVSNVVLKVQSVISKNFFGYILIAGTVALQKHNSL